MSEIGVGGGYRSPCECRHSIRVVQISRRARKGAYSLERVYQDVRGSLPADVVVTAVQSRFYSVGVWRRLLDAVLVRRERGDVFHVTGDAHYLTYFLSKRRTVLTVLDCGILDEKRGFRRWLLWFFWFWLPEKRCRNIVAISRSTKEEFLRQVRCDPEKVIVIGCNVSNEFTRSDRTALPDKPRVLLVGTTPNKNIERTAAALKGLKVAVAIIGKLSASQVSALEKNGIDYVARFGLSRSEVAEEYRRCDLVIFASTYEGFGLPIIEANAVGRPVVTSSVWSMPEVAADAACLVDPFDVDSIRQGVIRVLSDGSYRNQLVRQGFKNVERFRTRVIAKEYAELYRQVADDADDV